MMWPFTKTAKPRTVFPPAPCGNDREHWFWIENQGWPCPVCAGIRERKAEARKEEELLERLAVKVAAKLKEAS